MINLAVSILFWVKTFLVSTKFSENDFGKIVNFLQNQNNFQKKCRSLNFGAASLERSDADSLEMCYNPIGGKYTKS